MASILLSKQPQIVADVLNEKAKMLVCKKFPKDYVGWVYIYCTRNEINIEKDCGLGFPQRINGKVVARFWCNKVGEIKRHNAYSLYTIGYHTFVDRFYSDADLQIASCLNGNELMWYLKGEKDNEIVGYAIRISKLEVFNEPLELNQIRVVKTNKVPHIEIMKPLTKAPSNYCYIEGEN